MSFCVANDDVNMDIADNIPTDESQSLMEDNNSISSNNGSDANGGLDSGASDSNAANNSSDSGDSSLITDDNSTSNSDSNGTVDDNSTSNSESEEIAVVKNYTLSDLLTKINSIDSGSVLTLDGNYIYTAGVDNGLIGGISIKKNLTIAGEDHYIDLKGATRLFKIYGTYGLVLENLTVKNGYAGEQSGGAIYTYADTRLTIKNCTFINNKVYRGNGGVINANTGTVSIYQTNFIDNKAVHQSDLAWEKFKSGMGSAIRQLGGSLTIKDSYFTGNNAYVTTVLLVTESGDYYDQGTLLVDNCTFDNNPSQRQGAIYLDEYGVGKILNSVFKNNHIPHGATIILDTTKTGTLVKNCLFYNNSGDYGGAIKSIIIDDKARSNFTIENCNFTKNTATEHGGALNLAGANAKIINCNFNSNTAKKWSGAIYARFGTITISGSNFTSNKGAYGGGIAFIEQTKAQISNSKFNKNTATNGGTVVVDTTKTVTIKNSNFVSNKGEFGTGIYVPLKNSKVKPAVTVNKCNFTKNSASAQGGAICVIGGTVKVTNSIFTSNTAKTYGGAVALRSGTLTVTGSKFNSNKADYAGAVYIVANKAKITSCSFTKNVAAYKYAYALSKVKNVFSKCTYKSNYLLKYAQVTLVKSGKYMKVTIKSNLGKALNKKFRLSFVGPRNYTTKYYTTKKGALNVKIPNLKKGTYTVSIKILSAKYYPVSRKIKI